MTQPSSQSAAMRPTLSRDDASSSVGLFVPKSEAYKRYREGCGRDATVKALWGSEAPFAK